MPPLITSQQGQAPVYFSEKYPKDPRPHHITKYDQHPADDSTPENKL
jgi:hypothetical protein